MGLLDKLFSRKGEILPPIDMSIFKVDMHSHLIPNIDDGSTSMDETIAMLAKFESIGYKKIITTPHIMSDYYRNTPTIILSGLADIREKISELNFTIQIEAAAEYYFDYELMDKLIHKEKLLVFGDNYVLIEFPFHSKPEQIEKLFFELLTQGYKPVVAHFERYLYFDDFISIAKKWRGQGVLIQLNFNSIFGHYGPDVKIRAERLIDSKEIDFAATDCHNIEDLLNIEKNSTELYLYKLSDLDLKNNLLL